MSGFAGTVWAWVAAIALAGPFPTPAPTTVPRVTVERLEQLQRAHAVVVLDVRSQYEYRQGHIAGALSWPNSMFPGSYAKLKLPKPRWIVTYCT